MRLLGLSETVIVVALPTIAIVTGLLFLMGLIQAFAMMDVLSGAKAKQY
jgi:hypothetical protein